MAVFAFQLRISLREAGRIAVVKIRIQIPYPRTVDTHVIPQPEIRQVSQFPSQRSRRYYVIIVFPEIFSSPQQVLHVFNSMFITHAQPAGKFFQGKSITQIRGDDIILMAVMRTVLLIKKEFGSSCRTEITVVVGGIVAQNIFHSGFHLMILPERSREISLESMFRSILLSVIALVFQPAQIFAPVYIISLINRIFRIGPVRRKPALCSGPATAFPARHRRSQ